jgi:hypothetical protein
MKKHPMEQMLEDMLRGLFSLMCMVIGIVGWLLLMYWSVWVGGAITILGLCLLIGWSNR